MYNLREVFSLRCLVQGKGGDVSRQMLFILRHAYRKKYDDMLQPKPDAKNKEPSESKTCSSRESSSAALFDQHLRSISVNPLFARKVVHPQLGGADNVSHQRRAGTIEDRIELFQDEVATGRATVWSASFVLKYYFRLINIPPKERNENLIRRIAAGSKVWSWMLASDTTDIYTNLLGKFMYAEGGFAAVIDFVEKQSRRLQAKGISDLRLIRWRAHILKTCIHFLVDRGDGVETALNIFKAARSATSPFEACFSAHKVVIIGLERFFLRTLLGVDDEHLDNRLLHQFLTVCADSRSYLLMRAMIFTRLGLHLTERLDYIMSSLSDQKALRSLSVWEEKEFIKLTLDVAEELLKESKYHCSAWLLNSVRDRFPSCFEVESEYVDYLNSKATLKKSNPLPALDRLAGLG